MCSVGRHPSDKEGFSLVPFYLRVFKNLELLELGENDIQEVSQANTRSPTEEKQEIFNMFCGKSFKVSSYLSSYENISNFNKQPYNPSQQDMDLSHGF